MSLRLPRAPSILGCLVLFLTTNVVPRAEALSLEVLRGKGYGAAPLRVGRHNALTVDVEINGHRARLVVDTGFSGTGILLHDSFLQELQLPAGEVHPVSGVATTAHGVKLGGFRGAKAERVRLGNVELGAVPLFFVGVNSPFRVRGGKGEGDGFVGAGFLIACGAVLDLQNAMLYLHPPGPGAGVNLAPGLTAAGMVEAPLSAGSGQQFIVPVRLNGVDARMVVDTGASLTTVDEGTAKGLRAASFNSRVQSMDASGSVRRGSFAPLRELRVGDHPLRTTDVRFEKLGLGAGQ